MSKSPPATLAGLMPAKGGATVPETVPHADPASVARVYQPPLREARDGLTIRVRQEDNRRLATMSVFESRTKQSLLDQAIREFLDRMNY